MPRAIQAGDSGGRMELDVAYVQGCRKRRCSPQLLDASARDCPRQ